MSLTPHQIVKEKHGSKAKLVDSLVGSLAKQEGEGKDAFRKRLLQVSSQKLLKLHRAQEKDQAKKK